MDPNFDGTSHEAKILGKLDLIWKANDILPVSLKNAKKGFSGHRKMFSTESYSLQSSD